MAKDRSNGSPQGADRESASVNLYVNVSPDDNTNPIIGKISDHQHLESQRWSPEKNLEQEGTLVKIAGLEKEIFHISNFSYPRPSFKTTFKMVIDKGDGTCSTRVAKLDTAATIDVISEDVVRSIGLHQKDYSGPWVTPIGPSLRPIGTVEFDWHILERTKTYTNTFAVLDRQSSSEFDVLLSERTIQRIGFYKVNENVWWLGVA